MLQTAIFPAPQTVELSPSLNYRGMCLLPSTYSKEVKTQWPKGCPASPTQSVKH